MTKQNEWIRKITLNDEIAFRKLFEDYYAGLCIYANRFIQDRNTREDLVQDVFCKIWVNRHTIDYDGPVTGYLVRSVKNHCLNYLRSSKQEYDSGVELENIPIYAEDNEQLFLLHEMEEKLHAVLMSLPEEYRIAFEMSKIENKSSSEIAETLGVSVRTVERYRNKAIEILKTELKDYLPLISLFMYLDL